MRAESQLHNVQGRFLAALREPIFGDSRDRSALPARPGSVSATFTSTANDLITPSATLQPEERLELYHRQYWYRLLDSIEEDFPALRLLLGRSSFWRLVEEYLVATPPTSFTLRHLGASLADFIAAHTTLASRPVHAEDMARLEYALRAAFEAGESPAIAASELAFASIALQPHVHLLALRTGADTLWRRCERGQRRGRLSPATARARRFVAVYRQSHDLRVERLPRAAFEILSAIDQTHSLDTAVDRVLAIPGLLRRRDSERVKRWFSTWTAAGWFRRADHGSTPSSDDRRSP